MLRVVLPEEIQIEMIIFMLGFTQAKYETDFLCCVW